MKKSEGVKKLANLIFKYTKVYDGSVFLDRDDAYKIMDGLIEMGMLPPETSKEGFVNRVHNVNMFNKEVTFGQCYELTKVNEWDDE